MNLEVYGGDMGEILVGVNLWVLGWFTVLAVAAYAAKKHADKK